MKKILFFLIGIMISLSVGKYAFAVSDTLTPLMQDRLDSGIYKDYTIFGYYDTLIEAADARVAMMASPPWGTAYSSTVWNTTGGGFEICIFWESPDHQSTKYYIHIWGVKAPVIDLDGDGLDDDDDLYPNDDTPYELRLWTQYLNSNGDVIGEKYISDRGDFWLEGETDTYDSEIGYLGSDWIDPQDLVMDGTITGTAYILTDGTAADALNPDMGTGTGSESTDFDGTLESGTGSEITDHDTTQDTGTLSDGTEIDNGALRTIIDNTATTASNVKKFSEDLAKSNAKLVDNTKITADNVKKLTGDLAKSNAKLVDNTKTTADNVAELGDYLKAVNKGLADQTTTLGTALDKLDGSVKASGGSVVVALGTGTGEDTGEETGTAPTAEEIGQAVSDKLQDSTQTYTATGTDSLEAHVSDVTAMQAIGTKYGTRWTEFTTVISSSDLFTVPFGDLFSFSGGGSSTVNLELGSWGGASSNSMSFDFAQYNQIWQMLGLVLNLLVAFACFKIVVVHHA